MAKTKAEEPAAELSTVSTGDLFEELRSRIAGVKNKEGSVWLKAALDKLKVCKYWFDKSEGN